MGLEYMARGCHSACDYGSSPNIINLPLDHGVISKKDDQPLLNANDHIPGQHIMNYGQCKKGGPCKPNTPNVWDNVCKNHFIEGAPALTENSTLSCTSGGTIRFC